MSDSAKKKWMSTPGFNVAQDKFVECNKLRRKPIFVAETGKVFESIRSAARELGVSQKKVQSALRKGTFLMGMSLEYVSKEKV